ncbi:MAG: hypothetical protein AABX08_00895 [Nanoarchaeota archaeon]
MNKILTLHPKKKGIDIDKEKYTIIKKLIIRNLKNKELTYTELVNKIKPKLKNLKTQLIGMLK